MEEKEPPREPAAPPSGISLGQNFLDGIGGLHARHGGWGDPQGEVLEETMEDLEQDPRC